MKIGLVRHFKVKQPFPVDAKLSPEELTRWFDDYNDADVEPGHTDLGGTDWTSCYSSDLSRAVKTAQTIYNGPVTLMKELREIQYPHFSEITRRKLPFRLWALLTRIAWLVNHRALSENKAEVARRIQKALDAILQAGGPAEAAAADYAGDLRHPGGSPDNTGALVVCHGALMMNMRKELLRRGFKGPRFYIPENGRLYLFEK